MEKEISISIRRLAELTMRSGSIDSRFTGLDRGVQGSRIHTRLQKQQRQELGARKYEAEVPLAIKIEKNGILYNISGRADGVVRDGGRVTVDEIKTTAENLAFIKDGSHPEHLAQAVCYGHILCGKEKLTNVHIRLCYFNIDTEEMREFFYEYSSGEAESFVHNMLEKYERFALREITWREKREKSLKSLSFPFPEYRQGQRSMAIAVYNSCKNEEKLFCCAPTGTGKTVSALFPAMKSISEGYGDRIFYLTAKTTSRKSAEDALELLCGERDFSFASITLTAKDKICFLDERACLPEACPYANGYYDRVNEAVYNVLSNEMAFSREIVEKYAREHSVCPYEFSLDLALWCDCVICDYNYIFDPVVYLRRFLDGGAGEYIFLVDESHNLLDRGREMYSAQLNKSDFFALKKALPKEHKKLHRALSDMNAAFVALRKMCKEKEQRVISSREMPDNLTKPVAQFLTAAAAFLDDNKGGEYENELLNLYFGANFYQKIESLYGNSYISLIHNGRDVSMKLFCLDPSDFLRESLNMGRAAVLFSATLLPLQYYRRVLGGLPADFNGSGQEGSEDKEENSGENPKGKLGKAKLLNLESPFIRENLAVFIASGISTKYSDRQESLESVVELIYQMAAGKTGNYIAYFPSYAYMEAALSLFNEKYPGLKTVCQQSGMTDEEREDFLAGFTDDGSETMLAFCVMGGVFSEGVDLAGERLIGSAVVGVGLPQIGPVPDAVKNYYDDIGEDGFDYAYRYPGMNKVLQAGGRVIRTESDRGVLLLIDSRFAHPGYYRLLPAHWNHAKLINSQNARAEIEKFWKSSGGSE